MYETQFFTILQDIRAVFDRFDKDKSGTLDVYEFTECLRVRMLPPAIIYRRYSMCIEQGVLCRLPTDY